MDNTRFKIRLYNSINSSDTDAPVDKVRNTAINHYDISKPYRRRFRNYHTTVNMNLKRNKKTNENKKIKTSIGFIMLFGSPSPFSFPLQIRQLSKLFLEFQRRIFGRDTSTIAFVIGLLSNFHILLRVM